MTMRGSLRGRLFAGMDDEPVYIGAMASRRRRLGGTDDEAVYIGAVDDGAGTAEPVTTPPPLVTTASIVEANTQPAAILGSLLGTVAGAFAGVKVLKKHKVLGGIGGALVGSAIGAAAGRVIKG